MHCARAQINSLACFDTCWCRLEGLVRPSLDGAGLELCRWQKDAVVLQLAGVRTSQPASCAGLLVGGRRDGRGGGGFGQAIGVIRHSTL